MDDSDELCLSEYDGIDGSTDCDVSFNDDLDFIVPESGVIATGSDLIEPVFDCCISTLVWLVPPFGAVPLEFSSVAWLRSAKSKSFFS